MKSIFLSIVILGVSAAVCVAAPQPKKEVKKGNLLYNKGEFQEALKQYEDALSRNPDSDIVNFNLGSALYKTKDYKGAITHFEKALVSSNTSLEQNASYNLGNAKYKYGLSQEDNNLPGAIDLLTHALRHYERAMELDSKDKDAKYNYEFVKKELKRLKEKQQQAQSQKKEESEKGAQQKQQSQPQQAQEQQSQEQQAQAQQEQAQQEQQSSQMQSQQGNENSEEEKTQQAESSASPEKNKETSPASGHAQEAAGEMSEKEAEMLLESYRQEEEPRGLLKPKMSQNKLPEVQKDW
jgi:Ca-activated chloride channel family protein